MEYVTLNNGIKMPVLGYGVYQVAGTECERCVRDAIETGYRLIDTAQSYGNEAEVGSAVRECGVSREKLFITTKVWISNGGYEKAKASLLTSLRKLQTEYIDLVLIHQPFNDYYGTYRAMEDAYKEGWIRAIGVSNFYPDRLVDLCRLWRLNLPSTRWKPMYSSSRKQPMNIWSNMVYSMSPGDLLQKGGKISFPTRYWLKSVRSMARQLRRPPFAS